MFNKNEIMEQNLDYLKLPFFKENVFDIAQKSAEKEIGYLDFLTELINGEVAGRRERAVERRLRNAKIPYPKNLEQYQWDHPDKISRQQVENIFRLNFVKKRENVVFLGGCGLGKTHFSIALATEACRQGYSTLFTSAVDIINTLSAARAVCTLDKTLKRYISPQLLVIDELGYLPIDKLGADLLFQVFSKRYERGSIVITCNRPFKKWAEIFNNDSTVTSAILDRILHHCEIVVIEGPSFRMKEKGNIR